MESSGTAAQLSQLLNRLDAAEKAYTSNPNDANLAERTAAKQAADNYISTNSPTDSPANTNNTITLSTSVIASTVESQNNSNATFPISSTPSGTIPPVPLSSTTLVQPATSTSTSSISSNNSGPDPVLVAAADRATTLQAAADYANAHSKYYTPDELTAANRLADAAQKEYERVGGSPVATDTTPNPTQGPAGTGQPGTQNANSNSWLQKVLAPLKAKGVNFDVTPNVLDSYDRYTYHFKLSMVNDLDSKDPDIRNKIANNTVRKIIIAESGVTTGYNIIDCEIKDMIGSGFRNRNSVTTEISMTITEPYSMSMPEQMYYASKDLHIQNWRLAPMFLELTFKMIDQNGQIISDPKKIIKIYKIQFIDFSSTLTEVGATYKISAVVQSSMGFRDFYYIIPQSQRVSTSQPGAGYSLTNNALQIPLGQNTVSGFFNQLGEVLTNFYRDERQKNPDSPTMPIMVYKFHVADALGKQTINFSPTQNGKRLSFKSTGTTGEVTIGRGMGIGDMVDDVCSSMKNVDFFYKDDKGSTLPGGLVRIPRVECVVTNIGFDNILNDYIRKFDFYITVKESNRPVPTIDMGKAFQADGALQLERAKSLQVNKVYGYYYTGINTDIIDVKITFNQLHLVTLPLLQGSTVGLPGYGSSEKVTNAAMLREATAIRSTALANTASVQAEVNNVEFITEDRRKELIEQKTQAAKALHEADTAFLLARSQGIVLFDPETAKTEYPGILEAKNANEIRIAFDSQRKANDQLRLLKTRGFVEDITTDPTIIAVNNGHAEMSQLSYAADPRDIMNAYSRPTPTNTDDNNLARQVYSTIMSQLYEKPSTQMLDIELDIRGDPYWLGVTDLERQEELESFMKNRDVPVSDTLGSQLNNPNRKGYANYQDRDANIVLIFRQGRPPDEKTGIAALDKDNDFFNGVYTVIEVTHIFKEGKFIQKLSTMRDQLQNLKTIASANVAAISDSQPVVASATTALPAVLLDGKIATPAALANQEASVNVASANINTTSLPPTTTSIPLSPV